MGLFCGIGILIMFVWFPGMGLVTSIRKVYSYFWIQILQQFRFILISFNKINGTKIYIYIFTILNSILLTMRLLGIPYITQALGQFAQPTGIFHAPHPMPFKSRSLFSMTKCFFFFYISVYITLLLDYFVW